MFHFNIITFFSLTSFFSKLVYIHTFQEQVDVMASLQKPKRMTVIGSDGKKYAFLVKSQVRVPSIAFQQSVHPISSLKS